MKCAFPGPQRQRNVAVLVCHNFGNSGLPRDVRDKTVTSHLAQIQLLRRLINSPKLPGKFRGSRRNGIWTKEGVTGLSRTSLDGTAGIWP